MSWIILLIVGAFGAGFATAYAAMFGLLLIGPREDAPE